MVERPQHRGMNEDFGGTVEFAMESMDSLPATTEEPSKPPPRPYISRRRSSADSINSPQTPSPATESRGLVPSASLESTAESG